MIHPEDHRITKIMESLEQAGLFTEEELTLAEDYLMGVVDRQELGKLAFRDMSGLSSNIATGFKSSFMELVRRGGMEEGRKLASILFAAGQSTCMALLPQPAFYDQNFNLFPSEPEKMAAVYASDVGRTMYSFKETFLWELIKRTEGDTDILKKALAYQNDKTSNGNLILMGAYFLAKYPGVEPDNASGALLEEEDVPLMKEYGDNLINKLSGIYADKTAPLVWKEIESAIDNDKVDGRIMKTAKAEMAKTGFGTNQFVLRVIGSMGYINFSLSPRLKNVVKVCLGADLNGMLDTMMIYDMRKHMKEKGGNYDEVFGIAPEKYIRWAADKARKSILRELYWRYKEQYLLYMAKADFEPYNVMASILREEDPKEFGNRMLTEASRQRNKIINAFVDMTETGACSDVREYLEKGTDIETIYPYGEKLLKDDAWRGMRNFLNMLQSYQKGYGYDALGNKCEAMLMLCGALGGYSYIFGGYNSVQPEAVKRLFASVDSEKLSLRYQLSGYSKIAASYYLGEEGKVVYEDAAREIFRPYLADRREEMLSAFQEADSAGRGLALQLLSEKPEENKEEILKYAQDTAKSVKEQLLEILCQKAEWEEDVIALLSSKKAADRDVAVRVLAKWDGAKYKTLFGGALEKEKNGKVRALLDNALGVEGGGQSGDRNISQEDLVKEIHKGNKKRGLAWAYETPFSKVHKKNGEEAGEEYLQAVLLCYSAMSPCGISPSAATLAEALNEEELAVYVNELFDKWLEAGAESKKRWVLYAASIHGGSEIVGRLHHQIQEWPQAARGAIASEAVQALALNPKPQALLIVDGISRKFKFKQVKAAAEKALEYAASQLGITKEELADRIVPNLGFDDHMERCFDYGARRFTVTITPALEIEVFDESGKKLKNLPAPGKKDDEEKAAAAYDEFKQMKKQMKTTVSSQKMRLDMALSTERQWSVASWKNLFVKNPIMHQFAIGLIWGIYENRKLATCFRYMEDGSFNTEDEEEFELPEDGENGFIGLVHPIELSEESLEAWRQQLEDYEIIQPIEQLNRPVFLRTKEEEEQRSLDRFGGCIVNDLSLGGKLTGEGWYRGSVQDGGAFYTYYREDPELSLGVELHFSGSGVGGLNEDVTVYEARFYEAGTIKRGSYEYDEADDKNSYLLKDVPKRYFSEVARQIAKATSSGKDRDESWKTNRR